MIKLLLSAVLATLVLSIHIPRHAIYENGEVDDSGFTHMFIKIKNGVENVEDDIDEIDALNSVTIHCVTKGELSWVRDTNPAIYVQFVIPTWKSGKRHMEQLTAEGRFVFSCEPKMMGQSGGGLPSDDECLMARLGPGLVSPDRDTHALTIGLELAGAIKAIIGNEPLFPIIAHPGHSFSIAAINALKDQIIGMVDGNMLLGPHHRNRHWSDEVNWYSKEASLAQTYQFQELKDIKISCLSIFSQFVVDPVAFLYDQENMPFILEMCEDFALNPFPIGMLMKATRSTNIGNLWRAYWEEYAPTYTFPILMVMGTKEARTTPDVFDGSLECYFDELNGCRPRIGAPGPTVFDVIPNIVFEPVKESKMLTHQEDYDLYMSKVDRFLASVTGGDAYVPGQDWSVCMYGGYYYEVDGQWCNYDNTMRCECSSHMNMTCVSEPACTGNTGRVERTNEMNAYISMSDNGVAVGNSITQLTMAYYYGPKPRFSKENVQILFDTNYVDGGFSAKEIDKLSRYKISSSFGN